jgi:cation diffusion facilitator family transporter
MTDRHARARLIRRGLTVSLTGSLVIAVTKVAYAYHSGSLAFVADGVHSLFDSASTLLGLVTSYWSEKPPDEKHPYGHQKIETLCVVALSVLLAIAGYEIASSAYAKLTAGLPTPKFHWEGVAVLALALVINFFVARYQLRMGKEAKSRLLQADAVHNQSDFWVSASVLVSVVGAPLGFAWLDPVISIGIALYLLWFSLQMLLEAVHPLVDGSVLDANDVRRLVESIPGVLHCHAVRSRGERDHLFLDLNVHLPGALPLVRAHEIAHAVEARLKEEYPGLVDVVVHTEPHGHPPCDTPPSKGR